jgi:hypothetical protein
MHALLGRRLASGPRRPADELRPGADAFLRRLSPPFFNVPDEKFRVACHVFAEDEERVQELENFWLDVLRLSRSTLTKTQINRYELEQEEASQRAASRDLPHHRARHAARSYVVRLDPRARRVHARRMVAPLTSFA